LDAREGNIDIAAYNANDPVHNAYLFDCAVSVFIHYVKDTKKIIQEREQRKLKLASFLLTQKIHLAYTDEHGDSLLVSVVNSYLPIEWRLKTASFFLSKGLDPYKKNTFGNSALDMARFKKDEKMFKLLSEYSATD